MKIIKKYWYLFLAGLIGIIYYLMFHKPSAVAKQAAQAVNSTQVLNSLISPSNINSALQSVIGVLGSGSSSGTSTIAGSIPIENAPDFSGTQIDTSDLTD